MPAQLFRFLYGTLFSFDAISSSRRNFNQPDLQGRSPWAGVGPEGTFIIYNWYEENEVELVTVVTFFYWVFIRLRYVKFHINRPVSYWHNGATWVDIDFYLSSLK